MSFSCVPTAIIDAIEMKRGNEMERARHGQVEVMDLSQPPGERVASRKKLEIFFRVR